MLKVMLTSCILLVFSMAITWQVEGNSNVDIQQTSNGRRRTSHRWIRSGGYGSGGNSCMCQYKSCDDTSDDMLYMTLGAVLGYLLATPMMMMTNMGGAAGGRAANSDHIKDPFWQFINIIDGKKRFGHEKGSITREMATAILSMMDAFRRTIESPNCSGLLTCRANLARQHTKDLKTTFDLAGCIIGLAFTVDGYALAEQLLPIVFIRPQKKCSDIDTPSNISCNIHIAALGLAEN